MGFGGMGSDGLQLIANGIAGSGCEQNVLRDAALAVMGQTHRQGDPAISALPRVQSNAPHDKRAAPRYSLLIRPAKLIFSRGEFLCVLRDISETGVSLRCFHRLPSGSRMELEMQNGDRHPVARIWQEGNHAGFRFLDPLDVDRAIAGQGDFPKRPLRIGIHLPVEVVSPLASGEGLIGNLSQQGARMQTTLPLAIDQPVRLRARHLPDIRAKVRWRKGEEHGLVFETTFALPEFALLAATLQCPALIAC